MKKKPPPCLSEHGNKGRCGARIEVNPIAPSRQAKREVIFIPGEDACRRYQSQIPRKKKEGPRLLLIISSRALEMGMGPSETGSGVFPGLRSNPGSVDEPF